MGSSFMPKLSLLAACLAVGLAAPAVAAVSVDFTNGGDLTGFTSGGGDWSLSAAGLTNVMTYPGWGVVKQASQNFSVSDVDATQNFKVSTDFVINSGVYTASGTVSVGLGLLSNNPGYPTWNGGARWYIASFSMPISWWGPQAYSLDINNADGQGGATSAQQAVAGFTPDAVYHLEAIGTYSGGNLTITAKLTDPGATLTQTQYTYVAPAISGNSYFGLVTSNSNEGTGTVVFKNFAVDGVPEPATLGVLGLVSLSALARRRRLA